MLWKLSNKRKNAFFEYFLYFLFVIQLLFLPLQRRMVRESD